MSDGEKSGLSLAGPLIGGLVSFMIGRHFEKKKTKKGSLVHGKQKHAKACEDLCVI